jgi:anthranilate synthase component 1
MNEASLRGVPCFYRRLAARTTPVRAFEALYADEPRAFLYESLEAHGGQGRYSFIGARPRAVLRARRDQIELEIAGQVKTWRGNPLAALRELVRPQTDTPPVAPFCGGAVGYFGYDTVRYFERIADENPDDLNAPDAFFLVPQEVICFDHLDHVVHVLLFQESGHAERLDEIRGALSTCDGEEPATQTAVGSGADVPDSPLPPSNMTPAEFESMVEQAKEYIRAGDIFQVVLSQRFEFEVTAPPLTLYQALRRTNPSPYMYYLTLDDLHIAGSSPEVLVRLVGRRVVTRPLAGTRRRGRTPEEDAALEAELRTDPKEQAEHVMLVDLGRNDLGRVSEAGSIRLADVLQVERHSRVMHLVSNVEGWLREGLDAVDVLRATFPAGTVSGAPKVRAMEIIESLEPARRGIYAGAIGYLSLLGDMDLCIAIRTMVIRGRRGFIQAGAGIVADSIPRREYQETVNKARALLRAVELVRSGRIG